MSVIFLEINGLAFRSPDPASGVYTSQLEITQLSPTQISLPEISSTQLGYNPLFPGAVRIGDDRIPIPIYAPGFTVPNTYSRPV